MYWFMIIFFTISSSVDNLGVGLSYGIRKLNIRFDKNILIAIVCFIFSMAGISFGVWLASILPGMVPLIIGFFLLVIIAIRIMLLAKPVQKGSKEGTVETDGTKSKTMKGILPEKADFDGEIG